jgi:hypothetical protein
MNELGRVRGTKGLIMMACGPAMANEGHLARVKDLVIR